MRKNTPDKKALQAAQNMLHRRDELAKKHHKISKAHRKIRVIEKDVAYKLKNLTMVEIALVSGLSTAEVKQIAYERRKKLGVNL